MGFPFAVINFLRTQIIDRILVLSKNTSFITFTSKFYMKIQSIIYKNVLIKLDCDLQYALSSTDKWDVSRFTVRIMKLKKLRKKNFVILSEAYAKKKNAITLKISLMNKRFKNLIFILTPKLLIKK